ncbi:MAG: glycoside hydrolase family 32 protein [Algoriphagus sp.]|uniref:glycoside hydrolase family 32 protein n=1 Tax=Algoriphagus sp. TaxID=1872435 RepID=UPI0026225298|nr:glycoside hydrolase family 32 protein [Algoriphagus sp.]MDG1277512.1 glycoside hydrolase family 32 protein [Algoriphagus sp.]
MIPFNRIFILFLSLLAISCNPDNPIVFQDSSGEKYRPEYHFTPPAGWMNDPNGLVYLDGEYHLFYQYYPDTTVWGPMHWGHAVSNDLVNWENLPIALEPDSLGYIFSGSAVIDIDNSSGFGSLDNPPMVAIFTYHDMNAERSGAKDYQSQGIAYSLDKGRTWTKYQENPVLPNQGIKDFRDPKVSRITDSDGNQLWMMTLAVLDRIQFYSSPDLIHWKYESEFGLGIGAHGGVWECPDLLPFTTKTGETKWVLLVSINPGGPQMGSATQYFIGDFQNGVFTPDDQMIRWLDYGPDNYAGVTWSNLPEEQDRTILIGWMSNWLYAEVVPTESWRSAMTIPRELSLFDVEGTLLLKSAPAKEVDLLRKASYKLSDKISALPSQSVEIKAEIENDFSIQFTNDLGEKLAIFKNGGLITVDRSLAGQNTFHPDFRASHSAPMSWNAYEIRIFLDASSVEVFLNDGELVMTSLILPTESFNTIQVLNGVENVEIFDLKK